LAASYFHPSVQDLHHTWIEILRGSYAPFLISSVSQEASLVVTALIAWGGARLAYESGLRETTDVLGIPYLPFRIIWLFGLSLFCLSYILDISAAMRRFLGR